MRYKFLNILALFLALIFQGCAQNKHPLGSEKNPVKFALLPSIEAQKLLDKGHKLEAYLRKNTPYVYEIKVLSSYIAVVEAMGTKRVDVATLGPFPYLLAQEKYGAYAVLTPLRFGSKTYGGQIIARADSGIRSIKDLNGKKFAFVDPSSTSGFLLASKSLKDAGVKLSGSVFAQKHDSVVSMVYQRQVDAGATFHTPPHDGKMQDARRLVLTERPDVEKVVKIIGLTSEIPNDPVVVRKGLPQEIVDATVQGLLSFIKTEEGQSVFRDIYSITDFEPSTDARYDPVRDLLRELGKTATEFVK